MTIEAEFFSFVDAATTLGVYPSVLPQDIAEGVTYQKAEETADLNFDGVRNLQSADFDVTVWSADYARTITEGNAIKSAIVDYTGTFGALWCAKGLQVREIDVEDRTDKERYFGRAFTFRIFYRSN